MIIAALAPSSHPDGADDCPMGLADFVMNSAVISLSPDPDDASPAHSDLEDCCEVESAKGCSVSAPQSESESREPSNASLATENDDSIASVEEMHVTPIISPPEDLPKRKGAPTVTKIESEETIDKIKRHWSLHRAAVGQTRIPCIVAPDIPPRTSSSTTSMGSLGGRGESLPKIEVTVDVSVASPRSGTADNGQVIWTSKGKASNCH